jgi:Flp pilus assembly pilin Flp
MNSIKFNKRIGGRKQLGQGMTEYIIIVALVAIAAIGVYSAFGRTLQQQVAQITNGVAGNQSGVNTAKGLATAEAGTAATDAGKKVGMDTYGQNVTDQ